MSRHFEELASEPTCVRCGTHRGTFFPGPLYDTLICESCYKAENPQSSATRFINTALVEAALKQLIRILPITTRRNVLRLLVKAFHPDTGGSNELMIALSNVTKYFEEVEARGRTY